MRKHRVVVAGMVLGIALTTVSAAQAQPLGGFRWQLAPFCNLVTLHVTQQMTSTGPIFALNGSDDLCGAAASAPVAGTAVLNPDGTVGVGLVVIQAPGGVPVHVDVRVNLATIGGPWSDSAGNSGTFVFTPGAGTGGAPRPASPTGLPPGSITSTQLAPGAVHSTHLTPGAVNSTHLAPGTIGTTQINTTQIQARVSGACPIGQYLRGVNVDGSVVCEFVEPHISMTVDDPSPGPGGLFPSIAIGADGMPVISHSASAGGGNGILRVTRCVNVNCTGTTTYTVDNPTGSVGYTALAIGTDDLPIIAFQNGTNLRATHCAAASCLGPGNVSTTIDTGTPVGEGASITIGSDGLPIIAHHMNALEALRVTHCGNITCSSGNSSATIDDVPFSVGRYTSIAIGTDSLPIISHTASGGLRVTHCLNVLCTDWDSTMADEIAGEFVGQYTSLAIGVDGLPIISHRNSTTSELRVTHCGNLICSDGNVSTTVDTGNVGEWTSIAIGADGLPIISYRANTRDLRVTKCGNITCTAGNVATTVDSPGDAVGLHTSIAIGTDGLPIISHGNETQGSLRVTKCKNATCQ